MGVPIVLRAGYATGLMPLPRCLPVAVLSTLVALAGCNAAPNPPAIQTLTPGVVKIAITGTAVTIRSTPSSGCTVTPSDWPRT